MTEEETAALWLHLADDLQTLRDLANRDEYHISRYAEDVFKALREHYNEDKQS